VTVRFEAHGTILQDKASTNKKTASVVPMLQGKIGITMLLLENAWVTPDLKSDIKEDISGAEICGVEVRAVRNKPFQKYVS